MEDKVLEVVLDVELVGLVEEQADQQTQTQVLEFWEMEQLSLGPRTKIPIRTQVKCNSSAMAVS